VCPAVLKTAAFGYDGKGQFRVGCAGSRGRGLGAIGSRKRCSKRSSISIAKFRWWRRAARRQFVHYGAIENQHSRHILDVSIAPARVSPKIAREAVELARCVLERLDVVGVLCVEFFVTRDGSLLINELGAASAQLRALDRGRVCHQPVRAATARGVRAAARIDGNASAGGDGESAWEIYGRWRTGLAAACAFPGVKLHLYGKLEPRPGRKMGHLTALNQRSGGSLSDGAGRAEKFAPLTAPKRGTVVTHRGL
jgi:5-(carboxyamino)imidazole ribonucleotide synthase